MTVPIPAEVRLGGRAVGTGHPPFVVAELSGNHNRSFERAEALLVAAAEAGVDAVKLQTFTADTMTIDIGTGEFRIEDPNSPWYGKTLYKLYEQASTPWEWHEPLFRRARELGLICFSTPFDESAVAFLESLDVPCYKIASFENNDLPLIRRVARTRKPVILSAGMARLAEMDQAVGAIREDGHDQGLVLLKCTSTYPASAQDSHLRTLGHMGALFGCPVGVSDHTLGIGAALAAVALGASFIEKHFTLSRAEGGVDAEFSLEPAEMAMLVREARQAWEAVGEVRYGPSAPEVRSLVFRRSVYVIRDIGAGEAFTPQNVRIIRPGLGLEPKYYDLVLGMRAARDLKRGEPLAWDALRESDAGEH